MKKQLVLTSLLCTILISYTPLTAQQITGEIGELAPARFAELSLEQLMDIEITSVSKKKQKLSHAAAAIFVITQEDIRRSGVTTIPEALRMVPGLQVARMDANKWAITSRGFNGRFANKLLVLFDGRSVYTPLFSGVFWDIQDTILEDIDRIEVIRGPGGTLWGANAVNGVINIITKESKNTQGTFLSVGTGSEEKGFLEGRYGGTLNENFTYRIFGKAFEREEGEGHYVNGRDGHDDWRAGRGGFRAEVVLNDHNKITLQGDIYDGNNGQTTVPDPNQPTVVLDEDASVSGGNALLRWTRTIDDRSDLALQVYYDNMNHREFLLDEDRDTLDFDFQHRFGLLQSHEVIWGAGYRLTADEVTTSQPFTVSDKNRNDELFSAFIQDEITISPDTFWLTFGAKYEHNNYTDDEIQPSARFTYLPNERQTLWGAVSRAVRTPARLEHTLKLSQPLPSGLTGIIQPDDKFDSETLTAYELGYRFQPFNQLTLDLATFYNVYDDLQTLEAVGAPNFINFTVPVGPRNKMDGEAYGAEITARWKISNRWRLQGHYSYMDLQLHIDNNSDDTEREKLFETDIPQHQASIRSTLDLGANLEFDTWLRFVDSVSGVSDYLTLDVRLGWKPNERLEISIAGQNLLESEREEYVPSAILNTQITEIERGVYGRISWRF